ncbi:MAG: short-chain dehydrogenase [Flavobacteriaceae bacterium]|nr:short-chain dehydrogenase [Flavobacteriaceae bacterium]
MKKNTKNNESGLKRMHRYYSLTGFYSFVGNSVKKALPPILIVVVLLVLVNFYLLDFNDFFTRITETYSPISILAVFFASEAILGLIPPEIFIAWTHKTSTPIVYLCLLALLSYTGGIISYFIGKWILRIPAVFRYVEGSMKKHLRNVQKWGGFLIVVGALLPIPFSMTSMAAGTINYKFKNYLLFGLLRFVRFFIYGAAIFSIM